jgi:LPXTG-motif cell wall-anchored protein
MGTAGVFGTKSMKEGIMDRNRFDDLTRAMATGASRRDLLKGVLGGVAAGAAVTVMPDMVGAQDETCIEPGGECVMEEDAVACCGSYTCFEAICDNARGCWDVEDICDEDYPCCDETMTCVDGTCTAPTDAADDDATGGTAETLPSTGIGDSGSSSGWLGAVAAGGAVAAAATVLRRNRQEPRDDSVS